MNSEIRKVRSRGCNAKDGKFMEPVEEAGGEYVFPSLRVYDMASSVSAS